MAATAEVIYRTSYLHTTMKLNIFFGAGGGGECKYNRAWETRDYGVFPCDILIFRKHTYKMILSWPILDD